MSDITIIAEFGTQEPKETYQIQYRDGSGEWGHAVGTWEDTYKVEHDYDNPDVATKLAQTLFNLVKKPFRVVEVHENNSE